VLIENFGGAILFKKKIFHSTLSEFGSQRRSDGSCALFAKQSRQEFSQAPHWLGVFSQQMSQVVNSPTRKIAITSFRLRLMSGIEHQLHKSAK